jgi:pilus assembly protein CpaE
MGVVSAGAVAEAPRSSIDSAGGLGRKIVAFMADEESVNVLRQGLQSIADELDVKRGSIAQAMKHFEKDGSAETAIVDISGLEDPLASLDELARVCPPDIKMLVIGENNDIGFYRQLVQERGVTDYLPKPITRDGVQRLLLPHLTDVGGVPAGGRGGHIVAVCGARGGSGATTIAVNTALEIAHITKAHVALLDLHLQHGTAALKLSARSGPGLRIALEDPERADALFLERTAINIEERLRLISAEEPMEAQLRISEEGVARVIKLLQQKFNYIVIDLPMPMPKEFREAVIPARHVVTVLGPDIAGVRDTQAIRRMMGGLCGSERVFTVLNRADAKGGLSLPLVQKGLESGPDVVIPDLGRKMVETVNLGVPARNAVPALSKHLAPLVREIVGMRVAEEKASLLQRLLKR